MMSDDTRPRTVESDQCAALSEAGVSAADRAVAALRALGREAYSHQRQALQLQSDGGDVLLCAATGAGKSAAYQAAAYAAPDWTLIVVLQPLVELIHEQTARTNADFAELTRLGWSVGRAMHGAHYGRPSDGAAPAAADEPSAAPLDTPELAEGSLAHAIAYDPQLRIVYVTPEELASKESGRWSSRRAAMQWALATRKGEILAWAYDECHLVDRWGSTFRDAYLHVEEACTAVDQQRRQTRRIIRMALTATLTLGQHSRLGALLGMRDFVTVCGGDHARSNLHLAVRHPTARELATSADTDAAVAVLTEVLGGMLPTEALSGLVVMYVSYARSAPSVADAINAANFALPSGRRVRAVAFSGQLDAAQRRAVLDEFDVISEDRPLVILVTTCAAGTGMDPNNEITLVVHLRLPPSILDLWQEWGRAGRSGSDAWCVLCVSPAFVVQTLRFASKKPTRSTTSKSGAEAAPCRALTVPRTHPVRGGRPSRDHCAAPRASARTKIVSRGAGCFAAVRLLRRGTDSSDIAVPVRFASRRLIRKTRWKNFTTKLPRTTLGTGLARTGTNTGVRWKKLHKPVLRGKKRACLQSEGRHPTSTTHIKVLRQRWLLLTKEQRSFVLNSPLVHNQRR